MKKLKIILLAALPMLLQCNKKNQEKPGFAVYGLSDCTIVNDGNGSARLSLSVAFTGPKTYPDDTISLSVAGIPEHLSMDSTWQSRGNPPFNTDLFIHGDPSALTFPSTYALTLSATSRNLGTRVMHFNIIVPYPPSCTQNLLGKYYNCHSYCNGVEYTDSIYADPVGMNKIWFSNFNNTGVPGYAFFDCYNQFMSIPDQVINGVHYSGGGLCYYHHKLNFTVTAGTDRCVIDMY